MEGERKVQTRERWVPTGEFRTSGKPVWKRVIERMLPDGEEPEAPPDILDRGVRVTLQNPLPGMNNGQDGE